MIPTDCAFCIPINAIILLLGDSSFSSDVAHADPTYRGYDIARILLTINCLVASFVISNFPVHFVGN